MATLNKTKPRPTTHEGAPAYHINAEQALRRSVMSCLLWEDSFYESGQEIAVRIAENVKACHPGKVYLIAVEARERMKLRHVPLLIARVMASLPTHRYLVADTLAKVIQRPDELAEFMAIYWKDGKCPLSAQVKKGLSRAFAKFNEYELAKYNRDGAVKLRDVLFLCHAKPSGAVDRYTRAERKNAEQYDLNDHELLYKRLVDGELETPDTWEVALSAGEDKAAAFRRLMSQKGLGGLAFLRNLRNMREAGITATEVGEYAKTVNLSRVLPFRFIAAATAVPTWEGIIELMMLRALEGQPKIPGRTVLLIDGSASMNAPVSAKSDISRRDAACALAILLRELCEDVSIIGFSSQPWEIPPRRGFALRDAINAKVIPESTMLGKAVRFAQRDKTADRIIVITDEQSSDTPPAPIGKGYVINVESNSNGIGYGPWTHIDGWSEQILEYVREDER